METIWGQVDLQNNTLLPRLKKAIRKLGKGSEEDDIKLLDMGELSEEESANSDEDGDGESEGSAASNLEDDQAENEFEDDGDEEDDDARRIRERMEKVRLEQVMISSTYVV